jgi:Fe2+ or Zn2+ uptake regulation protein
VLPPTRKTPRKRALLEILDGAVGFLSAAELHRRLRAHLAPQGLKVGIAYVYNHLRSLALFGAADTLRGDVAVCFAPEDRAYLERREDQAPDPAGKDGPEGVGIASAAW